jgi:quinone-modifying oxidoreductase subunit QmoC
MISASWGQKDSLISDPDVWLCHGCSDCTTHCPRGAKPSETLAAIRSYIIEYFSFPRFMGSALKSPKYLLLLLLVPVIILFGLLYNNLDGNFDQLNEGVVKFAKFLPHGILEVLFIGGNVLIFLFAGIGVYRFWKNLKTIDPPNHKTSFAGAVISTVKEIVTHKNFRSCSEDSSRFWGHFLIFYGFMGAMVTAGLAVGALVLFDMSPIPPFHPIKILGNVSGLSMVTGCIIVAVHRIRSGSDKISNTYGDWLLISFIFLVSVTGLLTQSFRWADIPFLAYNIYFVHMVFIFFLLWYAPYSKLGHMFYRAFALVYLKQNGRINKDVVFK